VSPKKPWPRDRDWFRSRIEVRPDGCWDWQLRIDRCGYGRVSFPVPDMQGLMAHRVAYEAMVGPIPEGMTIDHLCRNTKCINPDHLRPATQRENILGSEGVTAKAARRTHCIHGHPFAGDNLLVSKGVRYCRECMRRRYRASRLKQREERVA
jgi:hypothetical protein